MYQKTLAELATRYITTDFLSPDRDAFITELNNITDRLRTYLNGIHWIPTDGQSTGMIRKQMLHLLDVARGLCFPMSEENINYQNEQYREYYQTACSTLEKALERTKKLMRLDYLEEEEQAIKKEIMAMFYRMAKIDKKINRHRPNSLLTPGTTFEYYIKFTDGDIKQGVRTVDYLVQTGVDDYIVMCKEMVLSIHDPSTMEPDSFHIQYVTKILKYVPGNVKAEGIYNRSHRDEYRRTVPKRRFSHMAKEMSKLNTPRSEMNGVLRLRDPVNYSSHYDYVANEYLRPRSKHHQFEGNVTTSLISHLIQMKFGDAEYGSYNFDKLISCLIDCGVIRIVEKSGDNWDSSNYRPYAHMVANKKRLRHAVNQNAARCKWRMKLRLKTEAEERARQDDDFYDDMAHMDEDRVM